MYTEQDYLTHRKQLKTRSILLGTPAVLMLIGIIISFIVRIQWLTMVLTMVCGFYCIFCHGMLLYPISAYIKHMDNVLHGRTHQVTGLFKEMEAVAVVREGVEYWPMLLSVGNLQNPEDDRLFYYDAHLEKPDWQVGDSLTLTAHDKYVGKWERA